MTEEDFAPVDMFDGTQVRRLFHQAIVRLDVHVISFVWWPYWQKYHVVVDYRGLLFEMEINPKSRAMQGRRFEVRRRLNNYVAQVVDWQAE